MTNTQISNASSIKLGTQSATAVYIGSTKMWPVSSVYTELEYIECDNDQYINLGVNLYETLNTLYDIAIKFNITGYGYDTDKQGTMFNSSSSTYPYPGLYIRLDTDDKVRGRYITANNNNQVLGNKGDVITISPAAAGSSNVYDLHNRGYEFDTPTTLFCATYWGNNALAWLPYRFATGRVYWFKLWVNGVLVRDMIPCKDSNDVVGMLDRVNNVFYTSPNGAAFIAGPVVSNS